jgi:protease IV
VLAYTVYAIRYLARRTTNTFRRFIKVPDYVVLSLEESYPELRQPRQTFWTRRLFPAKPSIQDLAEQFNILEGDPRVRGVILRLSRLHMPLSQLQTLRDLVHKLRQSGKQVVAWATGYDSATYYVACAAEKVLLQTGGWISPLGIRRSFLFLADALDLIGVKADILQISPYKSSADFLSKSQMSDEMREMIDWLMDADYAEMIHGIAEGRHLEESSARTLMDKTPCSDLKALESGLVDKLVSEEDLPSELRRGEEPARLSHWEEVKRLLRRSVPPRPGRYVALLRIEGMIVEGRSQRFPYRRRFPIPFLLDERAGNLSVVQEARRILADKYAAAVVIYVDSGGGSAAASEAITAALEKIAAKKPLVVAMGSLAGSGGYYVSTPGHWIVAQPSTLTGSIGVLFGKIANAGLFDKLLLHRETLSRGQHATLLDIGQSFSEEERTMVREQVKRTYDIFLNRVTRSRKMTPEVVEAIGAGRVWTGRQALERRLVDELGGLDRALIKARQLAGLPEDAPLRELTGSKHLRAPVSEPIGQLHDALRGLYYLHQSALCLCPLVRYDPSSDI